MRHSDKIGFTSRTDGDRFWVFNLRLDGDELRLFDESVRVTHFFQRN